MTTERKVVKELRRIANINAGHLRPAQVVEAARPVDSPLHSQFEWDDTVAGAKWRLHQARVLIRVCIQYIETGETKVPEKVFVSLRSDRQSGQGYRTTVSVLSDQQMRSQLLSDAMAEMELFQRKYSTLKELVRVFAAMKALRSQTHKSA